MWARIIAVLRSWGLVAILIAGGLGFAWRFVAPPPPEVIRIATGPAGGAYADTGEAYARALQRRGFRVELRPTDGAAANLALLRAGAVDLALMQGGIATPAEAPELVSLGSIFREAAWVFLRATPGQPPGMRLEGRRVAVGPEGSGTRALALALLQANGVEPRELQLSSLAGTEAAAALLEGGIDAAILVSASIGPAITRLLRAPDQALLLDFQTRAAAYATVLPYLTPVVLPRSGLSLEDDLPAQDVTLMAPAAYVAARRDINDQVATLMVRIMQESHRGRQLFALEGRFPNALNQDLPLQPDAARAHERGATILQSYLPFRVAVQIERLWVLAIPLVTLALPLIRFAPPLYTWQMASRIYRWYDALRRIEAQLPAEGERRAALLRDLAALEARVAATSVPASYGRHQYALRRDIDYVRRRIGAAG